MRSSSKKAVLAAFTAVLFNMASAQADIVSILSQGAAKVWGGKTCGVVADGLAPVAANEARGCLIRSNSIIANADDIATVLNWGNSSPEGMFFESLAYQQSIEMACADNFTKELLDSDEAQKNILERVVQLREAKQRLSKASTELATNPKISDRTCSEDADPDELHKNLCREIAISRAAYEAIFHSIPLSGTRAVNGFLNKVASTSDDNAPEIKSLDKQLRNAYADARTELIDQKLKLTNLALGRGDQMDRGVKYALMSDPLVVKKVLSFASPMGRKAYESIACDADQKYHSGVDALEKTVALGTVLISSGSGFLLRAGTVASKVITGANELRAVGALSLNSTRALQMSAMGLAAATGTAAISGYQQIEKACFSKKETLTLSSKGTDDKNACVSAPTISQLNQDSCVLEASLAVIGFVATAPTVAKITRAAINAIGSAKQSISVSKVARHLDNDPRKGIAMMSSASKTVDRSDNFTSPATQQFILSKKASPETLTTLKSLKDEPKEAARILKTQGLSLSEDETKIVSALEEKFRLSSEILNATAKSKGEGLLSAADYPAALKKHLTDSFAELSVAPGGSKLKKIKDELAKMSDDEFRKLYFKETDPKKIMALKVNEGDIQPAVAELASKSGNFDKAFTDVSDHVSKKLEALPVGISYRTNELTSTVRFGDQHFFGGYYLYSQTGRGAYLKSARKLGGLSEAEMNLPSVTKKRLAVNLDRTYQSLDSIYGLEKACDRTFHFCGTNAPFLLIKSGAPVISYGFGTPAHPILSMAVQKAMGLKHVKEVRLSKFNSKSARVAVPIVLAHEVVPYAIMELPLYTLVIGGTAKGVSYLYDEISNKFVTVDAKGNIDWKSEKEGMPPNYDHSAPQLKPGM
jgi:hypothetical protein